MPEIFSNEVIGSTEKDLLPFWVDTVINASPFVQRTLSKAKKWTGRAQNPTFQTSKNTNGGSFRGLDTLSIADSHNVVTGEYTPSSYAIPIVCAGDEMDVNAADETKALDMVAGKMQIAANSAADDIATQFYSDGTGNGGKDFLGLGAHVDDGTSVATIAGLSRTTYPTLAGTVTSSSGTLTLAKMDTLYNATTDGTQGPSMIYTTKAVFSYFGQLLKPMERVMRPVGGGEITGSTGFKGLEYNGMEVVADPKCTSGAMIFVDEKNIPFYAVKQTKNKPIAYQSVVRGNDYSAPIGLGFAWTGWKVPVNGDGVIAHIILRGQLVGHNPKRSGKLTAITGI